MDGSGEIRWQQRLESFRRALSQLEKACEQDSYSVLERAGLVQTFGFSFELAWKTLKDLLYYEGYDEKTPRSVIRRAYEVGHIDDIDIWFSALGSRNQLTHIYDEAAAQEAERLIKESFAPMLRDVLDKLQRRTGAR